MIAVRSERGLTVLLCAMLGGVGAMAPRPASGAPPFLLGEGGANGHRPHEPPGHPAAGVCRALAVLARPIFEPLTWGEYEPDQWFRERTACYTLLGNGLMGLGTIAVQSIGHPRRPPVFGAGSFDRFFRHALRSRSGESILDESYSGVLAPAVASGALLLVGSRVHGTAGYRDALTRALPLLASGIGGANFHAAIFKKAFGRERPFLKFGGEAGRRGTDANSARESFYSGHATTAFFTAAFTDPVLADLIRTRRPDYSLFGDSRWSMRALRLGQAVALYGLAAAAGYSRIDIDDHYMTDVLAGALFGTLHGYLTYRWGYRHSEEHRSPTLSAMPDVAGLELTWKF